MIKPFDNDYIKSLDPCEEGWENLIEHYPNWSGTPLEFLELEHVPVEDKQWLLLREVFLPERDLHLYACFCAESVLHIFEKEYPNDKRPRKAIEAKRKWLNGEIDISELMDAEDAADVAAWAAAWATSEDASWATTWDAARVIAMVSARVAARDTARATAWDTARGTARVAVREKEKQLDELKRVFKSLDDEARGE